MYAKCVICTVPDNTLKDKYLHVQQVLYELYQNAQFKTRDLQPVNAKKETTLPFAALDTPVRHLLLGKDAKSS